MPGKYVIAALVAVLVVALGIVLWFNLGGKNWLPKKEAPKQEEQAPVPTTSTYSTSTFSIVYPNDFTVDATYAYQGVPKKPIAGVKFIIPSTMATGTNLSSDSGLSVESLPHAKKCTADIYFYENVKAHNMTIGSTTYSVASSTGAAAGNRYEEQVYAVTGSNPCTAVRYFIHYGAIENYPAGIVHEFDRGTLLNAFDSIRNSLTLH